MRRIYSWDAFTFSLCLLPAVAAGDGDRIRRWKLRHRQRGRLRGEFQAHVLQSWGRDSLNIS